jgi:multisubunit Na+/H+ antiporter MnhG subunit
MRGTGPWGRPRRHSLAQIILAGLAVLLGLKVFSAYRNQRGSWLGKAVLGALVLIVIAAVSSHRSRRSSW